MAIRLTPEEWEKVCPALERLAVKTVSLARAVIVEGKTQAAVVTETGMSRQSVSQAIKKVEACIAPYLTDQLVPVTVWLPPLLAEKVKKMAEPYLPDPQSKEKGHNG